MTVLQHEGTFPVMARTLPILVGSHYRTGYLARPDQAGSFPTVVLISGHAAVDSHDKFLTRRLARTGIAVVAVEMSRPGGERLSDGEALQTLDKVHEWCASDDNGWSRKGPKGLLGVGAGGRFALLQAAQRPWAGSVAVVATPLGGDEDRSNPAFEVLTQLAVPVLGLYGAEDSLTPPGLVDSAQRANQSGSWLLYPGVGSGFHDEGSPDYDRSAAEDAITRLVGFFTSTLPAGQLLDVG